MDNGYISNLTYYLGHAGWLIDKISEINYGIQLYISKEDKNEIFRVYQNTKGKVTLDSSPLKDIELKEYLLLFGQKVTEGYPLMNPPLIGTDEAGKGDYFGPLCVCAVYADEEDYKRLIKLGVKDSKLLNDKKIIELAGKIKSSNIIYSVVKIGNAKFNEMYTKNGNINAIMGWAHACSIKNILDKKSCLNILTDKYGSEHWLVQNLGQQHLNVVQVPKAEQNAAVAAASILARDAFVNSIQKLQKKYSSSFPLGASSLVDEAGKIFVQKYSIESLKDVAKISFKNTSRILA